LHKGIVKIAASPISLKPLAVSALADDPPGLSKAHQPDGTAIISGTTLSPTRACNCSAPRVCSCQTCR
jgi:hypothetical protein